MDLFCFSLSVLVLVVVVMEVLVVEVVEVVVAGCLNWRSEAFLESFSIYGNNLENLFNPKYRLTTFNI
jgi:ethanolamine transporter EutH